MIDELFRDDGYLRECAATVQAVDPNGIVLDRTVFYPPGDARLDFNMTEPLDKDELTAGIARLVAAAHPNTPEIGSVAVTRIEKKSAATRRVVLGFA